MNFSMCACLNECFCFLLKKELTNSDGKVIKSASGIEVLTTTRYVQLATCSHKISCFFSKGNVTDRYRIETT